MAGGADARLLYVAAAAALHFDDIELKASKNGPSNGLIGLLTVGLERLVC